jgi:putative transposase
MANTYTQLLVQLIFVVKFRQNLIAEKNRVQLEKYMCGIINNNQCKVLAIYCNPDHCHVLIGLHPSKSLSDLARDIKASSSKFINENNWFQGKFEWQTGFAAFSYNRSHLDRVVNYILNQHEHHRKKSFKEEYLEYLKEYEIEYDEKYIFEFFD